MATTSTYITKTLDTKQEVSLLKWQRVTLLCILGYEAAGCLLGGILLIASPNGAAMHMPVQIMHGTFTNFTIPGFLLFGLGVLSTIAFVSVLLKTQSDWFMTCISLGALTIWFVTEIIILRELHWLHLMWGAPVFIGWVVAIPLILSRIGRPGILRVFLICGAISSLWYIAICFIVPSYYQGYDSASYTISELSAKGSPTRVLWVLLTLPYSFLTMLLGWGVIEVSSGKRYLRLTGWMILIYTLFNFYWPPMSLREAIAAGAGSLSDSLHIVWAMFTLLLMITVMGFGATASGGHFRWFTILIYVVFAIFGTLTWLESPGIKNGTPTPFIGLWERINVGAFMVWVIILSIVLLRKYKIVNSSSGQGS